MLVTLTAKKQHTARFTPDRSTEMQSLMSIVFESIALVAFQRSTYQHHGRSLPRHAKPGEGVAVARLADAALGGDRDGAGHPNTSSVGASNPEREFGTKCANVGQMPETVAGLG